MRDYIEKEYTISLQIIRRHTGKYRSVGGNYKSVRLVPQIVS